MAEERQIEGKDFAMLRKAPPWGELAPVRATERGLQFLRLIFITPLRLDKLGTSPQGEAFFVACGFVRKKDLESVFLRTSGLFGCVKIYCFR